jgi:hypothetical protein
MCGEVIIAMGSVVLITTLNDPRFCPSKIIYLIEGSLPHPKNVPRVYLVGGHDLFGQRKKLKSMLYGLPRQKPAVLKIGPWLTLDQSTRK